MVMDGSPPAADAVANGGGLNSPQSRRSNLHFPWASVVRGDPEQNSSPTTAAAVGGSPGFTSSPPVEEASVSDITLNERPVSEAQPENSENNGDNNAAGQRRSAWSTPPNGAVVPASVMGGAYSWPTLSETTRPIPRSLSDTSTPVSDGSTPSSQAPIISQPPQRSANSSSGHGNSSGNNPNHARPRSRNRGGGGSSSASGGGGGSSFSGTGPSQNSFSQPSPPMPPPFPVYELPYGIMPTYLDNSVRGPRPIGGVGVSHSPSSNDHSSPRSNSRRGNYSPRPRGDGQYHNNHGGRRDHDRRDVNHTPQYVPPPYMPPPPPLPSGAGPYIAPPPMRVFPGQIGFDMTSPYVYVPTVLPESFRTMPIVAPLPPPMIFPPPNENPLTSMIVKQIDFYFSDDNLVKDSYLRSKMDNNGWVPISLIASFRRVQQLTNDIPFILESLRYSIVVEVQGDKVRRRNDWSKWLISTGVVNSDSRSRASSSAPENASSSAPESASSSAPESVLATSLQEVSLDASMAHTNGNVDARDGHPEMAAGELSEESNSQSEQANGDKTEEVYSSSS